MFQLNILIVVLPLTFILNAESARILCIFPIPSKGHLNVFKPLTQELARRGHEVTIVTPFPTVQNGQIPERIKEIDISNVTQFDMKEFIVERKIPTTTHINTDFIDHVSCYTNLRGLYLRQLQYLKTALGNYTKDDFDLIFVEAGLRQFLVFSHVFDAPVIRISCCGAFPGDYPDIGAPTHPFLYPIMIRDKLYNLTLWEKMNELLKYFYLEFIHPEASNLETSQVREIFGEAVPSINELVRNTDLLFLQTYPLWEGNVPEPPNVVHLWGIHLKTENNLPVDLQHFLNSSTNGVIYVSFGSMIHTSWLPNNTIQAIMRALSRVPYDVFLKWEEDVLPEQPNNVLIRKWWPQDDILKHPNVKLFVSHGGMLSTHEAIVGGVPVIGVPFFGDQFFNAEKLVYHKIGMKLKLESITEESFYNAINTVIDDKNYRHNIIKLRSLMMDQPESALERAVWWTEHVLRHSGAKHLRSPAANMSWAEYYEIDLVVTIVFILIFIIVLLSIVVCQGLKYLRTFWLTNSIKQNQDRVISKFKIH